MLAIGSDACKIYAPSAGGITPSLVVRDRSLKELDLRTRLGSPRDGEGARVEAALGRTGYYRRIGGCGVSLEGAYVAGAFLRSIHTPLVSFCARRIRRTLIKSGAGS